MFATTSATMSATMSSQRFVRSQGCWQNGNPELLPAYLRTYCGVGARDTCVSKNHFNWSFLSLQPDCQPLYGTTHFHNSLGCSLNSKSHLCVLFSWCGFLPGCLGRCRECRRREKTWENVAENIADAVQCNSLMSCECCPIPERREEKEEIGGGI